MATHIPHLAVIDLRTGELHDGPVTATERRKPRNPYQKDGFMAFSQSALRALSKDPEITLKTRLVLDLLYSELDDLNRLTTSTGAIARALGMASQNVSTELSKLKRKKILIEVEAVDLKPKYLRLNARLCWKGDYGDGCRQYERDPELELITEKPRRKPRLKLVTDVVPVEVDQRQMALTVE